MPRTTVFSYRPGSECLPPDRLYLDASLPIESAEKLSELCLDTVTAESEGLARASITEQLAYATEAGRMFVSRAADELERFWSTPHAGVLVVSANVTSDDLVRHFRAWPSLLASPPGVRIKFVPPLAEFFNSLHADDYQPLSPADPLASSSPNTRFF